MEPIPLEDRASGASVRLDARPPFAAEPLLRFLADRAIPGVERAERSRFRRSIRTLAGAPATLALEVRAGGVEAHLEAGAELAGAELDDVEPVRTIHGLLDLDAHPVAIDEVLSADPALAPLVRRTPGIRVPGTADGFELAVRAVVGQQVSVAGARTLLGRIAARWGTALERPDRGVTTLFPTAEELLRASPDALWMPSARGRTVLRLSELVAAGALDLSGAADRATTLETLRSIPGVGPWTESYVAMRALRDPDAFPATDLGVRHGFEALGLPVGRTAILAHAERWRPWRSYAVMHLWDRAARP